MTLSHRDARQLAAAAFAEQFHREGTTPELQCLQAVAWLETNYGSSWNGAGVGSFNVGAIQKGGWTGEVFTYTDTHPNKDGTSTPYQIGFRKYPNAVAGFQDLCRVVYVVFEPRKQALVAAGKGDVLGFSTALHTPPVYYEGFGATDEERIRHHHNAVLGAIRLQCSALGEELPQIEPLPVIEPALLIGAKGPAVEVWQRVVGVKVDGDFGGATQTATRAWQHTHNLPETGVVTMLELIAAGLADGPRRETSDGEPVA
jgi:peptidoglycan hydrolase-like protein with peptidoglycan-binding domain